MTGNLLLDWAIIAVSLFNTVLLLWLGLTVILTTDHRSWGVWLVGGGLLTSGAFFISHTAILGYGLRTLGQGLNFWWRTGWLPVVISPLAWYVAMLWYAGFWQWRIGQESPVRLGRQRFGLIVALLLAVILVGLLIFANPLPSFIQVSQLQLSATPEVGGIPVLILVYPLYILLCIGLSLDALRHPAPSGRVMGDLARRRARPWLMAASLSLLLVSLLVGWVMVWVVLNARQVFPPGGFFTHLALTIGWFDLVIDLLIASAVVLMGRAIVSYEVFTGKTLPRRGFFRHWRSAVILAAGYGLVVGGTIAIQLRPIYSLLLTTMLMVAFYALFSWRSFVERDQYIHHLRPFVTSQRLYDHLLAATPTAEESLGETGSFQALCADILGARLAYLIPLGALAPLVGAPLTYPHNAPPPPRPPAPLLASLTPQTICLPLDLHTYNGALWAIPLWSERGLIGLLLLGEKRDGGLYTQEEMEIARASGERLIDTRASVELARRLMALQRQRLAQTQILDQQTRRVLHDEILPGLHTAMLMLTADNGPETGDRRPDSSDGEQISNLQSPISLLTDIHHQISNLLRELPAAAASEVNRLGLVDALRRAVTDDWGRAFDSVEWRVEPEAEARAQTIPALTAEVLFYAAREVVRNAARHGRAEATSPLQLKICISWRDGLELVIEDNGVGLAANSSGSGGSGQGLALHSTMMAVVGGTLAVESTPGAYTRVRLSLSSS
ncbi:MAG: hypothetical protein HS114_01160 [Anaerolineales bacterium]|nr:hypothetical protein [Anaerolineales bacterium]